MSDWTTMTVTKEASKKLHHVKALIGFVDATDPSVSEALIIVSEYYLKHNDPRKKS